MRIAGGTVLRRYMNNLERNMNNKNKAENQLYSSRIFNRASENPIQAARALRVRKAISDINTYQENLKTANTIYENAESSVMKVSSLIQATYEKLIQGAHGSLNKDDAFIVAESIEKFAEEAIQLMNVVVADRRIFGGVNNSSLAFKIEEGPSGKTVYYHGVPINQYQDAHLYPYNGVSYTDVGIGMTMSDNGRIDPQSAIPVTFNGAEILGCGLDRRTTSLVFERLDPGTIYSLDIAVGSHKRTIEFQATADNSTVPPGVDVTATVATINAEIFKAFGHSYLRITDTGSFESNIAGSPIVAVSFTPGTPNVQGALNINANGFPNNVIQLMLDAAKALKNDDRFLAAQYADALFELQTNVSLTIAKIGNTQEFIEFNLDRTTNNLMSLLEQQRDMEASKPEEQITLIKVLESIFSAQLQMGAQVVPMSIFNFIK